MTTRLSTGVDIVAVARVERIVTRYERAAETLFTERERNLCAGARSYERLAARFAAKEAVLKAFGTGKRGGMRWTEVEILSQADGRPEVNLGGAVAGYARRHGLREIDVSLSHTAGMAVATAVGVWDEGDGAARPYSGASQL
jgi:holo-[acyl-carrier protein] synthase